MLGMVPPDAARREVIRVTGAAGLVAAAGAVAAHLAGMGINGIHPFGNGPWAVNDALHQLLPQKAYVRELLLHPGGPNSLLFNWHSALGLPYLGDFATYAASPANLLLVLFPPDQLLLAAQVIALLQIGAAAGAMAVVLLTLHRSAPWPIAAALGVAYASSGWVTGDAIVVLSWLDGLVAFPVLLWAALRLVARRGPLVPALVVALFWTANYYTAAMATLGVGLVLLTLLTVRRLGLRESALAVARVVGGFALGIAMVSWLLLPLMHAVGSAAAVPGTHLYRVTWWEALAELFPGRVYPGSPGIFIGVGTLVLVLAAPWNRRLPPRTRIALTVLPVAAVLSMQVRTTQLAWHSFAVPNGSNYREAFVIAGILATTAWLGLASGLPGRRPLIGGAVAAATIAAAVVGHRLLTTPTVALTAVSLVLVVTVSTVVASGTAGRARWLALLMLVTILAESTWHATALYRENTRIHGGTEALGADSLAARRGEVPRVPEGERARTPSPLSDNDPLLLGYNGIGYYSSTIPRTTAETLAGLGLRYSRRRVALADDDPAARALLGIHTAPEDRTNAPVTVLASGPVPSGAAPGTVWATRELLAGTRLYATPALGFTEPDTGDVTAGRGWDRSRAAEVEVTARCEGGSILQIVTHAYDPRVRGSITWQGRTYPWDEVAEVHTLGVVPPDGRVALTIGGDRLHVRPDDVGCLDPAALDRLVTTSRGQEAAVRFGKERVVVGWPSRQTGDAVILTTALPGWTCRTDVGPVIPTARAGMLTVPVRDTTNLTCRYHTKGLWPGLGVSAAALVLAAALQTRRARRARRAARSRT